MVPGRFFHSSRSVFHDSVSVFMVFHGFRCFSWFQVNFFLGFQRSRLVFHESVSVFMAFHGFRCFFMVSGQFLFVFSKIQVGFSWLRTPQKVPF